MAQTAGRYAQAEEIRSARSPLEAFWTGHERSVMRVWQRSSALAWSLALPVPAPARAPPPGNAEEVRLPIPTGEMR